MKKKSSPKQLFARESVCALRRKRIAAVAESLPEASAAHSIGEHFNLEFRGRRLGCCLLDDHYGDGRMALNCKTAPDVNQTLVNSAPERFHIPKQMGRRGWLGLWVDLPKIDW